MGQRVGLCITFGGHGWGWGGEERGNSGLKANLISTSTVITSPNYHNSPAYLMRLIMWACLLSISRGCVASVGTHAIRLCDFSVETYCYWSPRHIPHFTVVQRHLYKVYINYDSLDQHTALRMKWMLNCIEPFPYAAWVYNNSPALGPGNIAYDLSLDSWGLH